MNHIVLLGDSSIDNAAYVSGGVPHLSAVNRAQARCFLKKAIVRSQASLADGSW